MARPDGSNRATPRWPLRLALALSLASALALQTGDGEAVAKPAKGKRAADDAGDALPVSSIKPGMKGYAVTVFSGTGTDRFEIEVIDTIDNYLPHQDAVLFRANDPRLEHSGIVGGMSGSPIYIEGKLVGALSYGWRFNKDPVGALTPISNMLEVGALPYRPDVLPHPAAGGARKGAAAWADAMLGLRTDPLPPRRRPQELDPAEGLVPLTVPLSVSGLGNGATRMLVDSFGLQPVRGGGAGGRAEDTAKAATPKTWKPGDSVSVVLVRGDSSVAGNGTVTWVGPKGDRLLAFGHSMFNDGPTNVPIADARVHTILNSVERSVKLSSPKTIQGLMYQDRQAAIALRTDLRAPMIPISALIQGPDRDLPPRRYDNQVAVGVNLTPNLVAVVLAEGVDEAARDATEVVVKVKSQLSIETSTGPRDVQLDEEVFFPQGVIGRTLASSRSIALLAAVLDNPFEVGAIRKVSHEVTLDYGAPLESIESLRLRDAQVRAGDVIELELTMRSYKGEERTQVLPLRVPDDAAGEQIQIEIAGGDYVRPYRPLPGDLDDLVTTIASSYPSRALVASIYREHEGLSTKHGLLHELPDSVLETLADQSSTRDAVRFKQLARRVIPTKHIIEGIHTLRVDVLAPESTR
ncbi:MAG: hypothetical protein IPH07_13150 [Deltaproteobacteria bacterium]|nr:hypothetical protein [Deltaproteobacteria bacterium]MBK8241102.1 hypothetical protein [Deltaproteobacteria bacterium]